MQIYKLRRDPDFISGKKFFNAAIIFTSESNDAEQ